jgi:hypothetical protein
MTPQPIPVRIDVEQILRDLHALGWRDYKVEIICAMPRGMISKLRSGYIAQPSYGHAARLHNFWVDQSAFLLTLSTTA